MHKRHTIEIITPNFDRKFSVMSFMEPFYLARGYHKCSTNFIIKFFYFIYFSYINKLISILKIFKNSIFFFKDPDKKDLLIYDCNNTKSLEALIYDLNYDIISVRMNKIKKIYISKNIIFYLILNFFNSSLKQNYINSLIKIMNPKLVITNVDNSEDFYKTSSVFQKTKIKFIVVQCSHRTDTIYKKEEDIKKIFIPEFLCFSEFDKKIYENRKCKINKYQSIGSLKVSMAKNHVNLNKIDINPTTYDICLVSEPQPITNADYAHLDNLQDCLGKIADFTYRLANEKNLKVVFSGKSVEKEGNAEENFFYKNYLKDQEFKISPQDNLQLSTYINIMRSKIVIGHISTVLREAFGLKKKVLVCKFTGHKDVVFPSDGICVLKESTSFEEFKQRVSSIIKMPHEEYLNKLSENENYILDTKVNTSKIIRERIDKILQS